MSEINRELRLKLLATMEPYQLAHFARQLILNMQTPNEEGFGMIDQFMVDAIDADPPELARGGIVPMGTMRMVGGEGVECVVPLSDGIRDARMKSRSWQDEAWRIFDGNRTDGPTNEFTEKLMAQMREPLDPSAGRLMIPAMMWTDDERDTPKMIEETLCVLEVALGEYVASRRRVQTEEQHKGFSSQVSPHIERVARLIEAARKNW